MNLEHAIDAAEKACQQYGRRVGPGEVELSMDDIDMIADAVKAAAPLIAAQALRDYAQEWRDVKTQDALVWSPRAIADDASEAADELETK